MTFTKIALTAATLMTAATAVTASDYFTNFDELDEFASSISLDRVTSSADGFVQFESFDGKVLGMVDITAGANNPQPVTLNGVLDDDIVAKLYHFGEASPVAERKIEVE